MINDINNSGLNVQASWDSNLQRLYLTSTAAGSSNSITFTDENSTNLMQTLLGTSSNTNTVSGTDAAVTVDGTSYSFDSNQFTINGVSYSLVGTTGAKILPPSPCPTTPVRSSVPSRVSSPPITTH